MALDAFVYCDCFERKRLKTVPPAGVAITTHVSGNIVAPALKGSLWPAFSEWKRTRACQHPGMIYLHRTLGSEDLIANWRRELLRYAHQFPILLRRVLYSGTHTCDWISRRELAVLANEVGCLLYLPVGPRSSGLWRDLHLHLSELVVAARHTGKTICF
jgi:hypothetical protein